MAGSTNPSLARGRSRADVQPCRRVGFAPTMQSICHRVPFPVRHKRALSRTSVVLERSHGQVKRLVVGIVIALLFVVYLLLAILGASWAVENNASIGDLVWSDLNGNGVSDIGEPGISGVQVTLLGAGSDGSFGTGDDINYSPQTTNSSGDYSFTELAPGNYRVDLDQTTSPGYLSTTARPLTVTLAESQIYATADLGLARPEWLTVSINPAAVTTFAGNGANATFDGTGTGAGFKDMGGVAIVGGYGYVGTTGAIRKVNLTTGEVTTFTGHATSTGCTISSDPTQTRFFSTSHLSTDGSNLYLAEPSCAGIRRLSLASGAASTFSGFSSSSAYALTYAPDGYLYVTTGSHAAYSNSVVRVDLAADSSTVFATLEGDAYGIASDGSYLWVAVEPTTGDRLIKRISLSDGTATTIATSPTAIRSVASAGGFIYAGFSGGNGLARIAKDTGEWINVAGNSAAGYLDGTGSEAWFSSLKGIASDGTNLWIADGLNRRLRKATPGTVLPSAQPPAFTTTLSLSSATVTTMAGNGASATVNGAALEASFKTARGVAVVGRYAYLGSSGSVRKVDLATGEVTTLAGHSTAVGCANSSEATAVRFFDINDITTDGTFLYTTEPSCHGVRRVSIATGATSPVPLTNSDGRYNHLTFASDGYLYATTAQEASSFSRKVVRIQPTNGTVSTFATLEAYAFAIASDTDYLWVVIDTPRKIKRIRISDGSVTTLVEASGIPTRSMTSAGDFLYTGNNYLRRFSKSDGTWLDVAGSASSGYSDGVGSAARFSGIWGLFSDGYYLWVVDSGNNRLRLAAAQFFLAPGSYAFGWEGYAPWGEDVNASLGNFVNTADDLEVSSLGADLEITRTYNSLDQRVGAFGKGWSFNYEMSFVAGPGDGGTILYPDARREIHTKNADGTYTPPTGYFSRLSPDGAGFKLQAKDGTVYRFRSDGKISSITDENSHVTNLTYDGSAKLIRVQDAGSGRGLDFSWTGDYISSVETDSVTAHGGPLTWKYYYSGDKLTKACDPRNNADTGSCIVYTYANQRLSLVALPRGNTEAEVAYLSDGKVDWRKDGLGNLTDITYISNGVVKTTDPRGNETTHDYDGKYRLTKETNSLSKSTVHEYDIKGIRTKTTDANGNVSEMTYDTKGNVTSIKNPENQNTYMSYDSSDNLIARRDARSSGPTDNTFATTYEYDVAGNRTKETSPATSDFPSGVVKRWTYTTGSESAVGGGNMPPGILRKEIDARGKETLFSYDSKGDLRETIDPIGLKTTFAYDELGRKLTETVISDVFPSGVSTTYIYDVMSNVATVTAPSVQNRITLSSHQQKTTNSYDGNENLVTSTVVDLGGSDPSRVTTFTYDANDRQTGVTDPEGFSITRTYDAAGNVSNVTDQEGRVISTSYDARNLPLTVTLKDFVDDPVGGSTPRDVTLKTITYDDAGRKASETDPLGRRTEWSYDKADRILQVVLKSFDNRDATTRDIVLAANTYDAAGNLLTEETGGGKRKLVHTYDALGRRTSTTLDPAGLNRATSFAYDENGNLLRQTNSSAGRTEEVRFEYDDGSRKTKQIVDNGTDDLVTTFSYDQRDNLVSQTDPRGNVSGANPADFTTDFDFDELSRPIKTTLPSVSVEEDGGLPSASRPTALSGYDTFSNLTHQKDPRAKTTTNAYDKLNRVTLITHPSYVDPDAVTVTATESFTYDKVGNLTARIDRRGETTDFTFDNLNRVVRQLDPLVTGEAQRGAERYTYDDQGNRTKLTDQRGAVIEWTYDDLDRVRTETKVVRRTPDPSDLYTTIFDYDDLGHQTYSKNPNNEVTTQVYNAASERTSTTDPLGKVTSFTYDLASRPVRTTDPLGRYTENTYDLAGRLTATNNYSPAATLLATTSFGYDAAGNQTSVTSPRGFTTSLTYDPANRLTQVVEPVDASTSITTSYGYDASANLTRTTDGEGRATIHTYQSWSLPEKTIEPVTTAHPALSDRTFTNSYDAGGLPTKQTQPGGVVITRSFDDLGRMTTESGSGGGAASATKTFSYDLAGHKTSASHPTSAINFTYDDRGLLTQSSGGAGTVNFSYDSAGRITRRVDPAGTHDFSWTSRSELDTATDPLTGVTLDYSFDDASQTTEVKYGTGAGVPKRSYSYDDLGRLVSDTLKDSSNATTASETYGYDSDSNLTSLNIDLPGNSQSGAHSYSYDKAGRIASWTHPSLTGPATVPVGWDKAGNRTLFGADTYSYDQRNRLTSSTEQVGGILPVTTTRSFTYTPRGTLSQITDGATTQSFAFDSLSRLTNYTDALSNVAYTYDSLDRIATRGANVFTYSGFELDPTSDGTATYSRSPSGRLLAMSKGTDEFLAGLNRHGDLTHLFGTSGAVSDTRTYDPFGEELSVTGSTDPNLGFQSDFTDPTSNKVWMGARWYAPNEAQFLSRDTVFGQLSTPISLNRYTYAFGDPLNYFDPDGHWPKFVDDFARSVRKGVTKAYRGTKSALTNVGRGVQTAASAVGKTISIQASRVQHKAQRFATNVGRTVTQAKKAVGRVTNKVTGGLSFGELTKDLFSMDTLKVAGKGLVNFGAGFAQGTAQFVSLGHWDPGIGPVYKDDIFKYSYGIGGATAHIEGGVALGGLAGAAKGAITSRFAGVGQIAKAIQGSRVASSVTGALSSAGFESLYKGSDAKSIAASGLLGGIGGSAQGLFSAAPSTKAGGTGNGLWGRLVREESGSIGKRLDADQDALIQLAKEAKQRGGVTLEEGRILRDWADEYGVRPSRGPESHPRRLWGQAPHFRIGPVNHIWVNE